MSANGLGPGVLDSDPYERDCYLWVPPESQTTNLPLVKIGLALVFENWLKMDGLELGFVMREPGDTLW